MKKWLLLLIPAALLIWARTAANREWPRWYWAERYSEVKVYAYE